MSKPKPKTNETFCIYCQKEFRTPQKLVNHIVKIHPGSHAHVNLVEEYNDTTNNT